MKLTADSHTPGGHRRCSITSLREFSEDFSKTENKKVIAHSRVSSHDQKDELKRQSYTLRKVRSGRSSSFAVIEDLGSGINY